MNNKPNPPIYSAINTEVTDIIFKIFGEMEKIFEELCPPKNEEDDDLPVVASFGILGHQLRPDDKFKVLQFTTGAMYVQVTNFWEKKYSRELWDFYYHIHPWLDLLFWLEKYRDELGAEHPMIVSVERKPIDDMYKVWCMETQKDLTLPHANEK